MTPTRQQRIEDMAYKCIELARDCESEAKRLRKLSNDILHPAAGVTVEPLWGQDAVRFVGPTVDFGKSGAAA